MADREWLTMASTMVFKPGSSTSQILHAGFGATVVGEDRNATALVAALEALLRKFNMEPEDWQKQSTLGITVDGAKVLVSGIARQLQQQKSMAHLETIYCGSHRVQRVDSDVTVGSKSSRAPSEVRKMAKTLNALLNNCAKFICRSTKRYSMLKRVVEASGYETVRCRWSKQKPTLLKYRRLQKN